MSKFSEEMAKLKDPNLYMTDDVTRNLFMTKLDQKENLLAIGLFIHKPSILAKAVLGVFASPSILLIGITNRRLLIMPCAKVSGKPIEKESFSVSLNDIDMDGNNLLLKSPNDVKKIEYMPDKSFPNSGMIVIEKWKEMHGAHKTNSD